MREIRLTLVGLGNLGWRFCALIDEKTPYLQKRFGIKFLIVSAVDSGGAAYDPQGLNLKQIVCLKNAGNSIAQYPTYGRTNWRAIDVVAETKADVLLEASPVNLESGAEPGLSCILTAIRKRMHVVTPNKGPIVVAFDELHNMADEYGVKLRYDGTVAGGLPALNVGTRDLRGADVLSIQAVPNLVTGYMMDMLTDGLSFDEAFERAKDDGVLEGDGVWDIDGWDAAAKLAILTRAVMGYPARIEDVSRTGIREVPQSQLIEAHDLGFHYRLIARSDRQENGKVVMSVRPTPLASTHPFGHLGQKQMGVIYETDIYGTITLIINEENPVPSAATMLRDLLDIYA